MYSKFKIVLPMYYGIDAEIPRAYRSCTISGFPQVIYKIGEWAEAIPEMAAKGMHLLVMDSLGCARQQRPSNGVVFRCECRGKVELPKYRIGGSAAYDQEGWNWWQSAMLYLKDIIGKGYDIRNMATMLFELGTWPSGTEMYRYVRLTEEVLG